MPVPAIVPFAPRIRELRVVAALILVIAEVILALSRVAFPLAKVVMYSEAVSKRNPVVVS